MFCKICKTKTEFLHKAIILGSYDVKYFHCPSCHFMQTESPYWLEESYKEPINITDTGYISRNLRLAHIASIIIYFLFNKNSKFIDYGGGYGIFVRLMRDMGFDFYWHDPYTINLFARGFEAKEKQYELVTSFETFEHFVDPIKEIQEILDLGENIFFSTELYGHVPPSPEKWFYYDLEHGQHISFYNKKTLNYLAERFSLNLWSNGHSLHLLTKQKINKHKAQLAYYSRFLCVRNIVKAKMKSKTISDMYLLKNI